MESIDPEPGSASSAPLPSGIIQSLNDYQVPTQYQVPSTQEIHFHIQKKIKEILSIKVQSFLYFKDVIAILFCH